MDADVNSAVQARYRRRATQYIKANLLDAAQTTLEALVQCVPDDVVAQIELADVLLRRGQLRSSIQQLLQTALIPVGDAQLIIQIVRRLFFSGEILAARTCLDSLECTPHPSAEMLVEQARLRWMLNEIPASLILMDRAIAAGVKSPDASYLYAMLCQFTGNVDQAGSVLETSLHQWLDSAAAVALANLRKQTVGTHHLDLFHGLLQRIPASNNTVDARNTRAGFESALFKELDDLGRYDEAWQALARSNALMYELYPYDSIGETAVTEAIIHAAEAIKTMPARPTPIYDGPTPIFIIGMTRSGTTLLDRMLSNHTQIISAGESNDFPRQLRCVTDVPPSGIQGMLKVQQRSLDIDFAELGARYLRQTQWRAQGRQFYVDKLPINFRMVHLIRRALPHAPILHMVREPMGVCFSNLKAMHGPASAYSYDMQTLAHYYGLYVRLTNHWRTSMPGAMLDISYAALVSQPAITMRQVLEHCGLEQEEACLYPERNTAPVATPSSSQVREPIHTRAIGEWQHYAKQLEPLRLALAALPYQPNHKH